MDITTKQMLSSALQDLARGLKKLRTVVDRKHESWGTCPACNYFTDHKSSWNKHNNTEKHELRCKAKSEPQFPTTKKSPAIVTPCTVTWVTHRRSGFSPR